jgi:histidinol-phosphate aminotransferase
LAPYIPGEQPGDRVFIKLNTNENPYPPSPLVVEAIRKAAGDKLRLYPDPESRELREAIAAACGVGPDQVFAGNGSDEVLAFIFAAFFEGGPSSSPPVLFPDISYSFYPVYAGLWGIPFRAVPLREDFSVHVPDYLVPSGGVILANPNAPTGMAMEAGDLLKIAEYQAGMKRVVVVDEAYGLFAGSPAPAIYGALSVVPHIQGHLNLLTVHTLSKMGALAGLRAGFAIGQAELIEGLRRVRDSFNSYPVDRLAQAGAAAAVSDAAYYHGITRRLIATRERVSAALSDLGFQTLPSRANFIFARHPAREGAGLSAALREKGILVRHFDKPRISGFLRITMGTDDEMDFFLETCKELL